ncbi:MAG TPA: hypothetical protein VK727_07655 [Steroidobacteraceae bacterium]|jgi:hypothetical protein|nr:hypothetical protein [Steroidobacteraceae bacterium]
MLKGMRNVAVLVAAASSLSGCHLWHSAYHSCSDTSDSYLKATSVPVLRAPVGIEPPDTKSGLQIPALNEPPLPPRGPKDPCLDEAPKFSEPRTPRPPPAP